ncbi:unnamed protein product [Phytophthora lilii]|uniref:Unnamed protein product n=1 Tax=Phytophthora lilii TaxID=2077276 RepID=A0A9W6TK96_9STRA|nr:unnamed protein product [Phytophthora lilii]
MNTTQRERSLTRFAQRLRARRRLSRFKFSWDINSSTAKDDIKGKVMDEFQSQDLASKISYPSSSYQLKEITMAKVNIIYRDHTLGKNIPIPDPIKKNRFIVDFPNTNNKRMFYCIAYHFEEQTQDLKKRMVSLVKTRVKQYCEYKCIEYSAKFFKDMEPIDILAFDELEDCFFNSEAMSMRLISRRWRNQHIPVSVSVCNSLTRELRCFINESAMELFKELLAYFEVIAEKIQRYNVSMYEALIKKILAKYPPTGMDLPGKSISHIFELEEIEDMISNGTYESLFEVHRDAGIPQKNPYDDLKKVIESVPVFGFNSGRYDINICKNELFTAIGAKNITSVIKNPSYINTRNYKFLDMTNYVPAGTSYDKYLKTYIGGCKCEDSSRCVCGLESDIKDEDYEFVKFAWDHHEMKTLKDLLIWYNNLDVEPFVSAIQAQRELFKKFDLDMFVDGVSLPGLSEKVMYQSCFKGLKMPKTVPGDAFEFPIDRFNGYETQDTKARRDFNMSITHLNQLLRKQGYTCYRCFCKLDVKNASADRINNSIGHIDGNIMMSCIACNVARKDMSPAAFRYQKIIKHNSDKLVYSIDKEKEIYHKMKANIAGGPSIIFNRFAKRNETTIRGGKPSYDGIIEDIKDDKIFGFLECDIRTPEHVKEYFSEMTPILKNIEIDCNNENVIGTHRYEFNQSRGAARAKPARKLIGSYFGEKILIYAPLLKWYLEHGMEITKTYSFIKASSYKAFRPFMEAVSDARHDRDVDKSKEMIADMMKLVGNAAFGRSGMDKSKHKEVKYEPDCVKVRAIVER